LARATTEGSTLSVSFDIAYVLYPFRNTYRRLAMLLG
jgi:hypothetical protein